MLLIIILDVVVGLVLYGVYRLRTYAGLPPLFALVSGAFFLQLLSAPAVSSALIGDLRVFPGPVILASAALFAVLFVFIEEGVGAARRLIYSVVVTAAVLGILVLVVRRGLASGVLLSHSPEVEIFRLVDLRVLALSSGLFVIDALAVLAIHEILAARARWLPALGRAVLSLTPVLVLDGVLLFGVKLETAPDAALGAMGGVLGGTILGRAVSGAVYGLILAAIIRLPGSNEARGTSEIRDPLAMFTNRERMELLKEQTERSQSSLRNLFASNIVGMTIVTLGGMILSANNRFLAMLGRESSELPLDWQELTPAEGRGAEEAKTEEIRATGSAQLWEKEFIRRDGARVPALVAMTLTAGRDDECLAVVLDLSRRRRDEAALKKSEALYRSLYDDIPLMYFTLDPAGTILLANKHGAKELGYEPSELVGRSVLTVFHPDDRAAVAAGIEESLQHPDGVERWEFRKVCKDGSTLWVRESVRVVERADGRREIMVVCQNITDRKEVERKIVEHEEDLRLLGAALRTAEERERREIAAGLHDDVGQVLAVTKSRLAALRAPDVAGDSSQVAAEVSEIGELIDRSIESIRTLTFELGSPVLYELGLEAGLQHLVEQIEKRHGIRFRFESDGSVANLRNEAGNTLFRVTRELVQNVVKHAGAESGRVRLRTESSELRISVEDDGAGFDATDAGEILTPDGGFGLFSVREQLTQIGGRLEIRSEPGRGTRAEIIASASS